MTGSLQIKNGVFYAVLNIKDSTGKRKQKWISTGLIVKGNKKKAEQFLNELKSQYEEMAQEKETNYIEPPEIMFCDFLKEWITLNKSNIQVTTYDGYIHMLNKHVYPYFKEEGILLTKVKPMDIQRYYAKKLEQGLSPNTVIKHHGIIRSALQYAVKTNLIKENAADYVDKPRREKFIASYYNADELNKLFAAAKGSTIETPILLAAYYGLRRSEVLGLTWDAIDFNNGVITIKQKVVRCFEDGKLVSLPQNKLKSETSYRSLPLCDVIRNHLEQVKHNQEKNKALLGSDYNYEYDGYICVNSTGNLLQPDYITETFAKLLKKHKLKKIRFHDLRHSCATLLLNLGFSMKEIQVWLGHSDFQITAKTYAHVDYKNKIVMIDRVSNMLCG